MHPQNMFQQQNISSLWEGQQALHPCTEMWKSWVTVIREKDGPKMNVFCFQRRAKVCRPFFFEARKSCTALVSFWPVEYSNRRLKSLVFCVCVCVCVCVWKTMPLICERCHFYQMKNLCVSHETSEAWCLPWGLYIWIYADDDSSYYTCDLEPVMSFAHKTIKSFLCR
jgi:hypothetical protein